MHIAGMLYHSSGARNVMKFDTHHV